MAALTGRIPVEINNVEIGNVTKASANENTPQTIKKYMNSKAEVVDGVPDYSWSITTSTRAQRQEILDVIGGAKTFSLTYTLGSQRFTLLDAAISQKSVSSSTDDAELVLSGVAPRLIEG